jgi:hypothetical protein
VPAVEGPPEPQANLAATVVIVSGLARSGSSMVMQMLVASGLPILCDGLRAADDDNPLGYFADERVKHLHANADWLKGARGRAITVVAPLLPYLPNDQNYRIVFIERNVDEVLASQVQVMARRGEKVADPTSPIEAGLRPPDGESEDDPGPAAAHAGALPQSRGRPPRP